jgi:hypothetical protein
VVDQEDEEVGVAAVSEAGGGVGAELLLDGREPGFGAFVGVVGAVEEIGSVGAVAGGEEDVASVLWGAGFWGEPGFRGEGVRGVVAVGDEAVGGVAAAGELLGEGPTGVGGAEVLLKGSVAACTGTADYGETGGGRLGEKVDGTADGVGAVKG